jgi:hypothetical protein
MKIGFLLLITAIGLPVSSAQQPKPFLSPSCEDKIEAKARVSEELGAKFFQVTTTSYREGILENEDGSVQNTMGDTITEQDLLRVEQTAECRSDHQGDHEMTLSLAEAKPRGMELSIFGGGPAYVGSLHVLIRPDLSYVCSFDASFFDPKVRARWKIIEKDLTLQGGSLEVGKRLYGRISVTFEEHHEKSGKSVVNKIHGYFKPVIMGKKR